MCRAGWGASSPLQQLDSIIEQTALAGVPPTGLLALARMLRARLSDPQAILLDRLADALHSASRVMLSTLLSCPAGVDALDTVISQVFDQLVEVLDALTPPEEEEEAQGKGRRAPGPGQAGGHTLGALAGALPAGAVLPLALALCGWVYCLLGACDRHLARLRATGARRSGGAFLAAAAALGAGPGGSAGDAAGDVESAWRRRDAALALRLRQWPGLGGPAGPSRVLARLDRVRRGPSHLAAEHPGDLSGPGAIFRALVALCQMLPDRRAELRLLDPPEAMNSSWAPPFSPAGSPDPLEVAAGAAGQSDPGGARAGGARPAATPGLAGVASPPDQPLAALSSYLTGAGRRARIAGVLPPGGALARGGRAILSTLLGGGPEPDAGRSDGQAPGPEPPSPAGRPRTSSTGPEPRPAGRADHPRAPEQPAPPAGAEPGPGPGPGPGPSATGGPSTLLVVLLGGTTPAEAADLRLAGQRAGVRVILAATGPGLCNFADAGRALLLP
ncbi:hypothetical protein H696_02676 [Fonticula alba]|uniref:Uncharacterized protein n=1 Tax=Fonticula alba TaxID=691883 RepID=A0A058Z7S6_FONAL|nr:hypothetical protein H696_02676 [Fonticula alba]KCV70349.1 hypothetical protein H696_02676 [Fonticula alba]|eukprot:XP_009494865.1 hypothetical protein H696_02676 [Fonticula alba]